MDAMVEVARQWVSCRHGEDIFKFIEQQAHQVNSHHGVCDRCGVAPDRALPHDTVVITPATHGAMHEIPQDRPQRVEAVYAQHHVVGVHGNDKRGR
jgi:hypothetical protein